MTTGEKVIQSLRSYGVKAEGPGRFRGPSPLRPGSDSNGFIVTIETDGEHGAWCDHVTGESGSLYDLARRLGVELPLTAPAAETKRAYSGLEEYAEVQGAPAEAFRAAGYTEILKNNRPALDIPTATGNRIRYLDTRNPRYQSPPNYKRCLYGVTAAFFRRVANGQPIVFCNGEASVVVGQHHGLAAFTITGGESEIPQTLMDELVSGLKGVALPPVVVALDCDETGRKTAHKVKAQFEKAGFPSVRAVDLGLAKGGDLANFCKLYEKMAGDALAACADLGAVQPDDNELYVIKSVDDVLAQPPVEWIIPNILPRQALAMVFGPSGTFKTFFALEMAYKLAFTERVIYVASEGGPGMRQRLEALIKWYGGRKPPYLVIVDGIIDLYDAIAAERLLLKLGNFLPASLFIVDPLANNSGDADENKGRDVNRVLGNVDHIIKETGATVLLVHHTNKGGRQERGHGALFARCDTVMRLSRLDDVTLVESHKSKDSRGFESYSLREMVLPLGYKNSTGEEVTSLVLLPADQVAPAADALSPKQRATLEAVQIDGAVSLNDLVEVIEARNKQEVYRIIKNLIGRGLLFRDGEGKLKLTPAGEAALNDVPGEGVTPVTGVTPRFENPSDRSSNIHAVTAVTALRPKMVGNSRCSLYPEINTQMEHKRCKTYDSKKSPNWYRAP